MKLNIPTVLLLLATCGLSACAFGPLTNNESARSVGESNHEFMGALGVPGYALKWTYGVTPDLDIGLQWESLSIGIRAKYAFINQLQGWSFAGALGAGSSIGGSHTYGDLIASYATGAWEPYSSLRLVRIKTDPVDLRDTEAGSLISTVDRMEYTYGQIFFGTRYWFNPKWLMSVEASQLFSVTPGISFTSNTLLGVNFGYRF